MSICLFHQTELFQQMTNTQLSSPASPCTLGSAVPTALPYPDARSLHRDEAVAKGTEGTRDLIDFSSQQTCFLLLLSPFEKSLQCIVRKY